MNLKKLLLCISVAGMVASCTSDIDLYDVGVANEQEETEITVNVVPFVCDADGETRSSFGTVNNKKDFNFKFGYGEDGVFGICALDGSLNMPLSIVNEFNLSDGCSLTDEDDDEECKLSINEVKDLLVEGNRYVIYYPYIEELGDDFKMTFNNQIQDGTNGDIVANNNCYFISDIITYDDIESFEDVNLRPLNSVIKLQLSKGCGLPDGNYSRIELVNNDETESFYSVVYRSIDNKLLERESSANLSLQLENCVIRKNKAYSFYLSAFPKNTGEFRVKVKNEDGRVFLSNVQSAINLKEGCGYVVKIDKFEEYHEYVDLGLSVNWAKMNIGAVKETEYGGFFAWGETYAKNDFSIYNYKFATTLGVMTKYDFYERELEYTDDAAFVNWGANWRMPTKLELEELVKGCYWEWTDDFQGSGIEGYVVYRTHDDSHKGKYTTKNNSTNKIDGYSPESDRYIFIPKSGFLPEEFNYDYSGVYLWSKSLDTSRSLRNYAFVLISYGDDKPYVGCGYMWGERQRGFPIRPVYNANK